MGKTMRIVILSHNFTKNMGYIEGCLGKSLARLGHEVHVVVPCLQHYYNYPGYSEVYEPFIGPAIQPCGTETIDGFTLHRLPHQIVMGHARAVGVAKLLFQLRPDIVQTTAIASWLPLEAALLSRILGFKLFTGAHQSSCSLAPELWNGTSTKARLKSYLKRGLPGQFVSLFASQCYAVTPDSAEVAQRFYGVPQDKCVVGSLGTDTELFFPANDDVHAAERRDLRERLGISPSELVAIYTGRLTEAKNALCLAKAVARQRRAGKPWRALFVGDGPQKDQIESQDGSVLHPFVPYSELPPHYRAADVAVWPAQITTSTLDATASGLPIVMCAETMTVAPERIEGNGMTYTENDEEDLARVLTELSCEDVRERLGRCGVDKVQRDYSWSVIAQQRVERYARALSQGVERDPQTGRVPLSRTSESVSGPTP